MEFFRMIINTFIIFHIFIIFTFGKSIEDSKKLINNNINSKLPAAITTTTTTTSALTDTYNDQLIRKARQSRCIRCFDDRYLDDNKGGYYNYNRYSYGGRGGSGGERGEGGGGTGYDDRSSWYYYPERQDSGYTPRVRYDRYPDSYTKRYDERYNQRTYEGYDNRYVYYDRYDSRPPIDYNRGHGYDNRDRYEQPPSRINEGYPSRDRYYDRPRGGGTGYDGRYYDRDAYDRYPPSRGGYTGGGGSYYDYKNYRPWDETYRGTAGFDNSGRGYYFASNRPNEHSSSLLPPNNYKSGPGQPYLPHSQSPPRPIQSLPNSSSQTPSYPPSSSSSSSSSPSGPSSYYYYQQQQQQQHQQQHPQQHNTHNTRPSRPDEDSSKGYAGGWGYANDRDKTLNYDDRDKDIQSSPYGQRPRPLGGSYLHDRDSNIPQSSDNKNAGQQQSQDDKFKDSGSSGGLSSNNNNNDGKKSNTINGGNKTTN